MKLRELLLAVVVISSFQSCEKLEQLQDQYLDQTNQSEVLVHSLKVEKLR